MGRYQRGPERAAPWGAAWPQLTWALRPSSPTWHLPRLTRVHVCVALAFLALCIHTFLLLGALGGRPQQHHRPHSRTRSLGRGGAPQPYLLPVECGLNQEQRS